MDVIGRAGILAQKACKKWEELKRFPVQKKNECTENPVWISYKNYR